VLLEDEQSAQEQPFDSEYLARQQRISDLRSDAFRDDHSLAACLGVSNSDLFELELNLAEYLRREGRFLREDFEEGARPTDYLLRVNKQIAQLTQLPLRMRNDGQSGTADGSSAKKTRVAPQSPAPRTAA
jgi:hypothetical protein